MKREGDGVCSWVLGLRRGCSSEGGRHRRVKCWKEFTKGAGEDRIEGDKKKDRVVRRGV